MKLDTKERKKFRIRNKLKLNNPNNRMRLTVTRSAKNITAQIIDDFTNKTLISATSNIKTIKDTKKKNVGFRFQKMKVAKKYVSEILIRSKLNNTVLKICLRQTLKAQTAQIKL